LNYETYANKLIFKVTAIPSNVLESLNCTSYGERIGHNMVNTE